MSDWQQEGFEKWVLKSRRLARHRPHPPLQVPLTHSARRRLIQATLGIVQGQLDITFVDYAQRIISANASWLCSKLAKDEGHTGYAGWIAATLLDPIEVWDRVHDGAQKRHYLAAYHGGAHSQTVSYIAVAISEDNTFVTAFQKNSASSIDRLRNGVLIHNSA